jgi:hypothetical protein
MQRSSRLPPLQRRSLVEAGERLLLHWQETERLGIMLPEKKPARGRPRRTPSGKNPVGSRIGKKMERRYAGHHRCAGSKAAAGKNVNLDAWGCPTCGVSEIAGATRSHAEASGDLQGRKHAYTLRRSDDDLTRRAAASPPGRWPGTPIIRLDTKSGRSDLSIVTLRTGLGSCRRRKYLTSRFDRNSGRVHDDAAEPKAAARDGPAAVAVRTPRPINLPGLPRRWSLACRFRGHAQCQRKKTGATPTFNPP